MAVPRMIALAEVDWSRSDRIKWERFLRKIEHHFDRLDIMEVNYCDAVFDVEILPEYDPEKGGLMISLKSEFPEAERHYTLDGTEPDIESSVYDTTFKLENSATIRAQAFINRQMKGNVSSREVKLHKAVGKPIAYARTYDERYTAGGDHALVNGLRGSVHHRDGNWQGFRGSDINLVIDLGKETEITMITVGFMQNITSWIFLPSHVTFQVSNTGEDGDFETIAEFSTAVPMESKESLVHDYSQEFNTLKARYVKLSARNPGPCPEWHPGSGSPSWVFVDELVVE